MRDWKIAKADVSHADTLARFNAAMALETEDKQLDMEVASTGVKHLLERPQYGFYLVAIQEETPVAALMITYEWTDWRDGLFWWVQSVYVKPEFRRQGIYRALYARVKEMAEQDLEVRGIRLYVEKENRVAHAAYRGCGMSQAPYRIFEEIL